LRLLAISAAVALAIEVLSIPLLSPRFAVREIVLRGDPRVTRLAASMAHLPGNTNFLRAPTRLLRERIEQVPAVECAQVARALPNRLVVTVERREAVAVIRRAEEAMLIDPEGRLFAVPDEWGWGLPELVATHLTPEQAGTSAGREELSQLLGVLRALGPDPQLRVARLELAGKDDVEITLDSGAKVRLGEGTGLGLKIKLLVAVLDRLGPQAIGYLDLSDPWAAYWRPRSPEARAGLARPLP
jgi:cell division protein FtsQ